MYKYFAYEVAKELSLNPNEILSSWSGPELLVAFGHYMNKKSYSNYMQWEIHKDGPKPDKYIIEFVGW